MKVSRHQSEREALFSHFTIDRAPDAVLWVDSEARCRRVNDSASRMLGYSREELESMTIHDFCPDHPAAIWRDHWNELKQRGVRTFETRLLRKDRHTVPVEISSNYIEFEGTGYACVFARDIAGRKETADTLWQLRRDKDLILDAAGEGIFGLDLDGRHTFVNPAAASMLGYSAEELHQRQSHSTWHHTKPDGSPYPAEECPIYRAYKDGEIHRGDDEVFIRKDGSSFPVAYTSTPIRDDSGQLLGAVVTFRDITERRRAEQEIARLNRRSELILNSAGEGIFGLDREGRHTFVNPSAASMLGYDTEELLGRHSHSTWHHTRGDGEPYPAEQCPIYSAYMDGTVHDGTDELFWRKDGTSFLANYKSAPLLDESGKLIGAVVTFQDITEKRRMAEKLHQEEKIAEVTRVLGDVSHDIKNMLMPVLSSASLLSEVLKGEPASGPGGGTEQSPSARQEREEMLEMVEMIIRNARRIQDQVKELADAVKGVTSPPKFEPCSLAMVADNVVQTLRQYAGGKGVELRVIGLDGLPVIQADERRLFSALYNLVNNAIAEVPAGGSVTVHGEPGKSPETIRLAVQDTGRGMPPEVRDSLFTAKAVSRKAGGTGLGTKIVKDVVDAHGGTITVESEEGKGTTFLLTLPVKGPVRTGLPA